MHTLSEERNLLTQVGQVVNNYEKSLRVTGNGFSFIQALRLDSDEVRFHTRLIGYLLNPNGGHFQGDKFLKLFYEAIEIKEDTQGFTVEIEKHVGKRDWENVEGGRIDLLISNSSKKIAFAIEIKIYAAEQEKQLQRYHNYLNRFYANISSKVYYLTLLGDPSLEEKNFNKYQPISFKDHMLKWIESCRLATIDQPVIRETLTQYIGNIKRLTNQNPNDQMSDEIIKLITSSDASFKAFLALTSSQSRLYNKFGEALIESIKKHTDLSDTFDINFNNRNFPNKDSEISFFLKGSNDLRVRLYWLDNKTVGIGMHTGGNDPDNRIRTEMRKKLSELELGKYLDFSNWAWLSQITELSNQPQLTHESWEKFQSEEFAKKIAGWVETIADAYIDLQSGLNRA